ncbi:MAG: alpha-1,2-fucosyltransferase [Sulfuricurvum sp.]|uniref:alpha-1,2-fucosyltransferase n=1 Tax=Sulfuricurvum sp. TaxID=2025608 RepID=UPI0025EC3DB3|nr:alpha-1,2-fucosyltransferase [Sulfuricurvum sp.]MCI4406913.1 alpha-1,2-fucosyltransferase [Sulfuricurvum sp.]
MLKIFQNKVVIKIAGGLGNQLFQYAMGRAISIEKNIPLWLDISFFKNDSYYHRIYLLNQFHIKAEVVLIEAYPNNKYLNQFMKLKKKIDRYRDKKHRMFLDEPDFLDDSKASMENYFAGGPCHRFDASLVSDISSNVVLSGYWQSEKYFKPIRNILFEDLTITANIPENIQTFGSYIQSVNSVCIGIRQYSDFAASANHFKLTAEYYEKAMKLISSKIENPHFFIFTLERQWAEENIKSDFPITLVTPNRLNEDAYLDLYLISHCKHFIIANSTYHWWGAYLSKNKEKIVIAPKQGWGNSEPLPHEWIKI